MPLTEAQKGCQSRYYQKNAEQIKSRMREYQKKRREGGVEADRRQEYYHTAQDKKKKAILTRYLEDDGICDAFKQFLRVCVETNLEQVPLRFLNEFDTLAIVRPENNTL